MEAYLTSIANRTNREMLAKLRCSNHPLLIEVGRHHKMDVDTPKCNLCDRIDDETHFVTECQLYTETRNNASVNSKRQNPPPPGKAQENFFEAVKSLALGQNFSAKARSPGQENTYPRGTDFERSSQLFLLIGIEILEFC